MNFVRIAAYVVGGLAIAVGLLWLGQGTGLIMWPQESFMLADRTRSRAIAIYSAVTCVVIVLGLLIGTGVITNYI